MRAARPDEVESRPGLDRVVSEQPNGGAGVIGERIRPVIRGVLAQRDLAAKLAQPSFREVERAERRHGRNVRLVVEVQARVGRLAEHQRSAGGVPRRGEGSRLEQHPVCDGRSSGELLDLACQIEELGAQAVVVTRRGCIVHEPPCACNLAREPGLPPSKRQAASTVGLPGGEPRRGFECG